MASMNTLGGEFIVAASSSSFGVEEGAANDAAARGLRNAAFLPCNANVNLPLVLDLTAPHGPLASCSIQFPDPWFKARHHKRRVVQPDLARSLAENIAPGGWLFIQSDVLEVAEAMREVLREHAVGKLVDARDDFDDWSVGKPEELAHLPTERENSCAELDRPVYRAFFERV